MKAHALAAMMAAVTLCSPAQAMEHKAVIEHAIGPIMADYEGSTRIGMEQIGAAGVGGRPETLRCVWRISLSVERHARLGTLHAAKRTIADPDVVEGSAPGWCTRDNSGAERILARHRTALDAAMMALVEQDRELILVEADSLKGRPREG